MVFLQRFPFELQIIVYYRWLFLRGLKICLELAINKLTLNQFKIIEKFRTSGRFGLDLYKALSFAKLQMSVFLIHKMRSLIKILNIGGPRKERWGFQI